MKTIIKMDRLASPTKLRMGSAVVMGGVMVDVAAVLVDVMLAGGSLAAVVNFTDLR